MEQLLNRFAQVAAAENIAARLQPVRLQVSASEITSQDELRQTILAFRAVSGWLTTQAANLMIAEWLNEPQRYGYVLAGELSNLDGSLHIRQSRNGWRVTRYSEGGGEVLLAEDVSLSSVRAERELMCYRNYWQKQEGFGLGVAYSRFTGLNEGVSR